LYLKKQGISQNRLKTTSWILRTINKNADLDNPDAVDQYIANRSISDAYKAQLTQVYAQYCKYQRIPYNRPKFKRQASRPIRIPTEEKINMIIAESGRVLATKLTLSKETGLRPIEVHTLKVKDVDLERYLVYPTTAKNGASRTLKISAQLASLIQAHITRFKLKLNDNLFKGHEEHYGDAFRRVCMHACIKKALINELSIIRKTFSDASKKENRIPDERYPFIMETYNSVKIELASFLKPESLAIVQRTYEEIRKMNSEGRGHLTFPPNLDHLFQFTDFNKLVALIDDSVTRLK